MHIGFVYDLRDEYLGLGYSQLEVAEFDSASTIEEIDAAFVRLGHTVDRVGRGQSLARRLADGERFDLVFSIAEGLSGRSREAQVPALCELFDQPYAFSDPLTMTATLDKVVAKQIVSGHGIPTATFAHLRSANDADKVDLAYPLFVKPVAEGSSKGISAASLVRNPVELAAVSSDLLERFREPVLVERYLPGRELTVGILGTGRDARVLAVMEVLFGAGAEPGGYTYRNKTVWQGIISQRLVEETELASAAGAIALAAWRELRCRDAGRVDVKLDDDGRPQFLEVNPLAGLAPGESDLTIMCDLLGVSHTQLIGWILESASARIGASARTPRPILATAGS